VPTQNRNKLICVVLAGLLVIALTGCSELPVTTEGGPQPTVLTSALESNGEPTLRTISINGVGMASAPPDMALIQIGAETIHTDAAQAISDNTERMTAVMSVLKAMKIEDKDIQTVSYSMWIEQVYDREGQPTGESRYHVVNQVRVRLRDLSKTGEVLQKALEAGANNTGGISFSVADPTALQGEARDRAIADARAKAQQLATGLGAQLGPIRQASEYGGVVAPSAPVEAFGGGFGGGGGPVPVSGGEFSVTVEIQVVFDIAE
jgi:uncharacterized protein YggE